MGLRLSQAACLGVRVPIFWFASADTNDKTQTTIEPYARFDIEKWFVSGRLNFPVGDPLRQIDTWGLLLGAGAGF